MSATRDNPLPPKLEISAGVRLPLGATVQEGGVNFAVFSLRATRVWLRLYRGATDAKPVAEVELEAATHRTYGFWHAFVSGARAGWFYTWGADGPNEPAAGLPEHETEHLSQVIRKIPDAFGALTILVDHDMSLVSRCCATTAVLDFGKLIALGPTAEVLRDEQVIKAYLGEEELTPLDAAEAE